MEPFLAWKVPRLAQPEPRAAPRAAAKTIWRLLKPRDHQSRFRDMPGKPQSVAINQAERELDETNGLVTQQYRIVKRLKQLGADTKDAILLLLNLLELQQSRQQRLSYLRMRGTGPDAGKFLPSELREDVGTSA